MTNSSDQWSSVDDPFFSELGQFILNYSQAEAAVKGVIAHECGVSYEVGRALFSDMRLRPIIDKLRRVHEAKGTKILPKIDEALVQFAHINDMRDKLMHQGFSYEEGAFFTSNAHLAATDARIRTLPISAVDLRAMIGDLRRIQLYFWLWGVPPFEGAPIPALAALAKTFEGERPSPWRYKPPQPILGSAGTRHNPQAQQPPPPPSQE